MLRINQFRVYIDELKIPNHTGRVNEEEYKLIDRGLRQLLDNKGAVYSVKKKAIDARKDKRLAYTYTLDVDIEVSDKKVSRLNKAYKKKGMTFSKPDSGKKAFEPIITGQGKYDGLSPVIAGAGPAGLFCAYILALNGLKPVIIEQGNAMDERIEDVLKFWEDKDALNPYSNVSFGEGGAGTFSDGKLNTSVKDPSGRIEFVKSIFAANGAPEEITYLSKPHIGTDELRNVIINLRKSIISAGGQVMFGTKLEDIGVCDGRLRDITVRDVKSNVTSKMDCSILVLATGHSARDTYEMLRNKVAMEQKDFAVGVRVAHDQDYISRNQYGELYDMLPAADYRLRYHTTQDRAVYSFCMCPGGYVVNASSEAGMTVTNGMSDHNRDSGRSNSAVVVNVTKDDFESDDVLAGVEFQKRMEKAAYDLADGLIPAQRFGGFISTEHDLTQDSEGINVCVKGGAKPAELRSALPEYVGAAIEEAMLYFDTQMAGFASYDTLLYGIETRTSAPVRILRDSGGEADVKGIYPCGEGAGYAGGIMSAAVDGIKAAQMIVKKLTL